MKKILLVEDDNKIQLAVSLAMKGMGYSLTTASDAVTAISAARRETPDVIVLDINLPAGDGFVVAERLMRLNQLGGIPIIFITASKQPGLREKAKSLGATNFLEKPFGVSELANAVESAFVAGGARLNGGMIG